MKQLMVIKKSYIVDGSISLGFPKPFYPMHNFPFVIPQRYAFHWQPHCRGNANIFVSLTAHVF